MKPQTITLLVFGIISAHQAHAQTNAGTIDRLAHAQAAQSEPAERFAITGITLQGNTLLPQSVLSPLLDGYAGSSVSLDELKALANTLEGEYQKLGYPLASVIVPPQKSSGIVILQAVEGKVDAIMLDNHSRVNDQTLHRYLQNITPNAPLNDQQAEEAIAQIRQLAGTQAVGYRLAHSGDGVDLALELGQAPLIDGSVQVDNYGSKSTGQARVRANVNVNSPTGHGEKVSLQAMSSLKGLDKGANKEGVSFIRLASDIPLKDTLFATVGAGHTRYELGGAFKDLNATGNARTLDMGLRYPALLNNKNSVWVSSTLERKALQDKVNSTGTTNDKRLHTAHFGANGQHRDALLAGGVSSWSVDYTLGHLDIVSPDVKALDQAGAKTQGVYHKVSGTLARTQYFNTPFSVSAVLNYQYAHKNLDSSEQMSLGGSDGVAAYHSNDFSVDNAMLAQARVNYQVSPNISVGAFYDSAYGKVRARPFGEASNIIRPKGFGLTLDTNYQSAFASAKLAWQSQNSQKTDKDLRMWLKAGYRF